MAAKDSVTEILKTIRLRLHLDTKVLATLGILALLVGGLVREADTCRAGLVVAFMREPPDFFEEVSFSEAESAHTVTINLDGNQLTRPFGFIHDRWEDLKRRYKKGDCLYEYRIDCGVLCGSEGYVLIRKGRAIDSISTWIS